MEPIKYASKIYRPYWGAIQSNDTPSRKKQFHPPILPYSFSALENITDAQHFKNHFMNFHVKSFENFQQLIQNSKAEKSEMIYLFKRAYNFDPKLIDLAGAIYNHQLYWDNLSPYCGTISTNLQTAIDNSFGSTLHLKDEFILTGMNIPCCGWLWLIVNSEEKLQLLTTTANNNPLMAHEETKGTPLLAIDLWEHAFINKFFNDKEGYLSTVWMYINWNEVSNRFNSFTKTDLQNDIVQPF